MIKPNELLDFLLYVDPYSNGTIETLERKVEAIEALISTMYGVLSEEQRQEVCDRLTKR